MSKSGRYREEKVNGKWYVYRNGKCLHDFPFSTRKNAQSAMFLAMKVECEAMSESKESE
jgi:hypothetical protein